MLSSLSKPNHVTLKKLSLRHSSVQCHRDWQINVTY